ncbi:epimerase [Frondihabitans sucicola]|uniref:Epimerase n=1 Tax=Frondihabitans sucicola TaxID=1268041 RepID=A0ABM8GHF9_9MICO|nr:NAD(P)-dependent oxidoreductase [Frondihabitans sucicola]BDZ47810.1 epimerase [Frondihabitans sucicola]BDZ52283.1 epimerase [Frondihabitans sucicola]
MSRIIVTGGSGRLGRSVADVLVSAGHDVVSLDRAPIGTDRFREVTVDLTDHAATIEAFEAIRPESVVHLAAIAVPFSAPEDVIFRTNTAIAYNVVEAAGVVGATRLLAASSPTVVGYGAPHGWRPEYLPLDEDHPLAPWNAYSLSKRVIEEIIAMAVVRDGDAVRYGVFRPCFVISPEEWEGAPTQQGHTVRERLDHPEHAAVSLFNYVDARDAGDFVVAWLRGADRIPNGSTFFVGAADALARESLDTLVPRYLPGTESQAASLASFAPAFSSKRAADLLGWRPVRSWRTELSAGAPSAPSVSAAPPAPAESSHA